MDKLLLIIKDWLTVTTSIGVIVGGAWAFYKWSAEQKRRRKEEELRQKKEIPSLDGKLSPTTMIPCEDGRLLVTVEALWNNHSPFQIDLDINKCQTKVFRIDSSKIKANKIVEIDSDGEPVCTHPFLQRHYKNCYFFEPSTASTIVNHFVLQRGSIYGIRMELVPKGGGPGWSKELVLDLQAHKSKTDPVGK